MERQLSKQSTAPNLRMKALSSFLEQTDEVSDEIILNNHENVLTTNPNSCTSNEAGTQSNKYLRSNTVISKIGSFTK